MNDKLSRQNCVLYVCGIIPVVWLALLAAPLLEGGLGTLLEGFGTALENPFQIVWCDKSLKTLLIFLMLYGLWALASTFPTSVSTGGGRNRVLPGGGILYPLPSATNRTGTPISC